MTPSKEQMMQYTRVGSSGLKISRIAMGTMSFGEGDSGREGWPIPYDDAAPFFRQALDLGINFWDTANGYNAGTSEEAVGRALKELTRRDDIVVATKVFFPVHNGPGGSGLSRKAIMEQVDASLTRLGTDYIDLYQIQPTVVPIGGSWQSSRSALSLIHTEESSLIMASWNKEVLRAIAESDDLYVSPFREDGTTYGTPTRVWPLVVDGEVYVRAANGQQSRWYQAAVSQKAGRINVSGQDHEVTFEQAGDDVAPAMDAAYEKKYPSSSAVPIMQGDGPTSATVLILPR